MTGRKKHLYQVSYRVWDGWQYNLPGHWHSEVETIEAANIDEAYQIATRRAETPSLIAHDTVTVRKKDIERLPDDKANTKGCSSRACRRTTARTSRKST